MHRILLRSVILDFPSDSYDKAIAFWGTALGTSTRQAKFFPEYTVCEHPASVTNVYLQHIGADEARVHFDIESDDQPAEVVRLVAAGAEVVEQHADASGEVGDWTVLRDPAGILFCVVRADIDERFEESSVSVG